MLILPENAHEPIEAIALVRFFMQFIIVFFFPTTEKKRIPCTDFTDDLKLRMVFIPFNV
jgi:hypothetical protein